MGTMPFAPKPAAPPVPAPPANPSIAQGATDQPKLPGAVAAWVKSAARDENVTPPGFVADAAKWEKAKQIAKRGDGWQNAAEPWGLVASIYQQSGGVFAPSVVPATRDLAGWVIFASARLCATDAGAPDENKPIWIQVAAEGEYKGHPSGPFDLRPVDLEQIVQNFRANPKFTAGADGVGSTHVVPFDFHHASEQEPARLAVAGAPAQAWALDLELRQGSDGKAQLWSLCEYLEPARTYVREGRYEGTSVAIWPDAVDPKTGDRIGWYLSSIAFTNDPFIQGMLPIAAARGCCPDMLRARIAGQVSASLMPGDVHEPTDLLHEGETPSSLDPGNLEDEDNLRFGKLTEAEHAAVNAAGARTLADYPWDKCIADQKKAGHSQESAEKICGSIKAKSAAGAAGAPATKTTPPSGQASGNQAGLFPKQGDQARRAFPMAIENEFLKILAARFNMPMSEEEVQKRVLAELAGGAKAQEALQAVLDALNSKELQAGLTQIQTYKDALAQLEAMMPELKSLSEGSAQAEEEAATSEVGQTMMSMHLPDAMKPALLAMRTGGVAIKPIDSKLEGWKALLPALLALRESLKRRLAARDEYRKTYPAPTADAVQAPDYISQPLVTTKVETTYASPFLNALGSNGKPTAPRLPEHKLGAGKKAALDAIELCAGANITQKAMAFVRSQPGGATLSHDDAHEAASTLLASFRD